MRRLPRNCKSWRKAAAPQTASEPKPCKLHESPWLVAALNLYANHYLQRALGRLFLANPTLRFFDSHVPKFSEILIERGNRAIFSFRSRGQQAVHEMNLRLSIAVQRIQMNRVFAHLNARARDQGAKRRCDVCPRMLIKRLQHKHALRQNRGQYHKLNIASIAGLE